MNCISNFLRGNKTYFIRFIFFEKKYKVRGVPRCCSVFVHAVKLFTGLYPSKMFDRTDGLVPIVLYS